jgi:hypothetical protein
LREARASAERCLDGWPASDESLAAGVMLGFEFDERADIPGGPLRCFAEAIYPLDWSGLVSEPTTVTWRLKYAPAEADEVPP